MNYVSKEEKKRNNEELTVKHGKVDKLVDDNGEVFGYVIRAESNDKTKVVFNISFNFYYQFKNQKMKWFSQSDLKHFAIKDTLTSNVEKSGQQVEAEDLEKFLSNEMTDYFDYMQTYAQPDVRKLIPIIKNKHNLKEYLIKCVKNTFNYYKNKELKLFFI